MRNSHLNWISLLVAVMFLLAPCCGTASADTTWEDVDRMESTSNALMIGALVCVGVAVILLVVYNSGDSKAPTSAQTGNSSCSPEPTIHGNSDPSGLAPIVDLRAVDGNGKQGLITGLGWTVTF